MADKPKSFEEFYYLQEDKICDIDVVEEYVTKNNGDVGKYEGNMYCPECRKAILAFWRKTSKRRAHLKRIPSSKHSETCSYNYEYASSKRVKEYVDSLTYNEIQDKLNSILNMLCKQHRPNTENAEDSDGGNAKKQNPMLIVERKENTDVLRALRRKRLNAWIDKSDGEDFAVFYGKVKLGIREKTKMNEATGEPYTFYFLEIFTQNKQGEWKYRTNIYRGGIKDEIKNDVVYNIVIIGHLDFKYKPFTIELANRDAIKFQEIDM